MLPRAGATLRDSITRLALPMPLEVLVFRALNAEGVDGKHERLVYAWEVAIQIAATSAWAVCRHLDLRSDTLDAVMPKLARPMFGHWLELLRAARALLATRSEAAAVALRPLLEGLEAKYAADERLVALAKRISALPKRNAKIGGSTIGALLDAIPVYRNETRGHGEPDTKFREESLEAVLGGLVAFCELARPTGAFRVVVVDRLEQRDDTHLVELASMEGAQVLVESHTISSTLRKTLSPARPYLHAAPELFVPLFPGAAGLRGDDGWALGWLKQQVRMPTLSFESSVAGAFSLAVADDDYASLLRATKDAAGEEVSEAVLEMDPWRGLLVYEEAHAGLFFGRGALTLETMSHLERRGVAVLCGASGSGKSSLMRAGLLPALRERAKERERDVVTLLFVPGARPLQALRRVALGAFQGDGTETMRWSREVEELLPDDVAQVRPEALVHLVRGLAAGGHHVALLVDQLEEVTTLCADIRERDRFLDLLTTLAGRLEPHEASMILTLRADKLDAVLEHAAMRTLLQRALEPIGTMGRDELVEVITRPLQGRRVRIEPGLPERILADVGEEPGGLALVSQLLSVLWDARGRFGDELTLGGYEAVGGVMGVLGRQADEARAEAMGRGDDAKARGAAVEQVFLRLAHRGDDGRFTRRRVPLATLAQALGLLPAKLEEQLAPFVARRLLVVSATIAEGDIAAPQEVEVAHEALLRGWPALKELLEREGEVTALRQEVERAAAAWEKSARRSELWSDATSNLKRAEELVASSKMLLAERERAFLTASRRAVTRTKRLARVGVAMIGLLAVVVAALGWQANRLLQTERHMELLERRSLRDALVAQAALVNPDPAHRADALLAGLRAAQLDLIMHGGFTPEVECALGLAVTHADRLVRSLELEGDASMEGASFSPDGALVVTASIDKTARIWDAKSGVQLARLEHDGSVQTAFFSPDGTRVVTASDDKTARIWDAKSGAQLARLEHGGAVETASFSPDGTRVVTASEDKTARIWDARTGTQLARLEHVSAVRTAAFSPDGTRVVTAGLDKTAQSWDAKTGALLARFEHEGLAQAAAFSPDGARVVTASDDKTARIWDAKTGTQLVRLEHAKAVSAAAFSADGSRIVTVSEDKSARVWDAKTGALLVRLEHADAVLAAAFSPDGTHVVTASGDKTARVWDVRTGAQLARLEHADAVLAAAFSPDGTRVVTASWDKTARIWDARTGARIVVDRLEPGNMVTAAAFSPDGARVVTASEDKTARVWDAKTGTQLARLAHGGTVTVAAFSPNSARVVTAMGVVNGGTATSEDKTARIWDVQTGTQLAQLEHAGAVWAAAFSPDGTRVVTASEDKTARIWDAGTGAQLALLGHGEAVAAAAFSPDGTRVVTASYDHTARIWDAKTGVQLALLEHGGPVKAAAFSPDGTRVVTASGDKTARIWDAKTGAQLARLEHGNRVWAAAFSPDGTRVVTAGLDKAARVWDAQTGAQLARLEHGGSVLAASFSPDGTRVVTASVDTTARVWDARTWEQVARLEHGGVVAAAAFSPDGTRVVTASEKDKAAWIWPVTLDAHLTAACMGVRRRPEFSEYEKLCAPYLAKADAAPAAW